MENEVEAKMDYSASMPETVEADKTLVGRAPITDQLKMVDNNFSLKYDHTPEMEEFGGDELEKMGEGEPELVQMLYPESPEMYKQAEGLMPVMIPKFGSEGETDKVFLKDTISFAISQIEKSFEGGTSDETINHWVKVCEESDVLDPALLPEIKRLAAAGKGVMNENELKKFVEDLKKFRSSVRIRKGGS